MNYNKYQKMLIVLQVFLLGFEIYCYINGHNKTGVLIAFVIFAVAVLINVLPALFRKL